MIISASELSKVKELSGMDEATLNRKAKAVESIIRRHTNNDFINRRIKTVAPSSSGFLKSTTAFNIFNVGDTVQIYDCINEGLYEVVEKDRLHKTVMLNKPLADCPNNEIYKVEYPAEVVEGALNMIVFDASLRGKQSVVSETISRHTVTYADPNNELSSIGYPSAIIAFMEGYHKARF